MTTSLFASVNGEAFDLKKRSSRPEFHFSLSCSSNANGEYEVQRSWYGLGSERISLETAVWRHDGLLQATMAQAHINEHASVHCNNNECLMMLTSPKKKVVQHEKTVKTPYPSITLLSVIFDIAANWESLLRGQSLTRSYLVLKVQAHTGVSLKARQLDDKVYVSMTPLNWLWRSIFGSTEFVFMIDKPVLLAINGLIEPRDIGRSGRYIEYLAPCSLREPIDLSVLQTNAGQLSRCTSLEQSKTLLATH